MADPAAFDAGKDGNGRRRVEVCGVQEWQAWNCRDKKIRHGTNRRVRRSVPPISGTGARTRRMKKAAGPFGTAADFDPAPAGARG